MGYVCDIDNDICLIFIIKFSILCWYCVYLFKLIVNDRGKFFVLIIVKCFVCFFFKKYKYCNFRLMVFFGLIRYVKFSCGFFDNDEEFKVFEYIEVWK